MAQHMLSRRPAIAARPMNAWERAMYRWHIVTVLARFGVKVLALPARHAARRWTGMTPVYGTVALWAVAALAGLHPKGWATLAVVVVLAAPFALWAASKVTPWASRAGRSRVWLVGLYLTGSLLMVCAAKLGAGPPMPGLYAVWGALFGWRWWWFWHRHRNPETPRVNVDDRIAVWADRIAAEGKKLAGSLLQEIDDIDGGWSATVNLVRTDLTADHVYKATGAIAARYELPATSVVVEPHPSSANHLARLMVFEENPLQNVQLFTEVTLDKVTGAFTAAVTAEGRPARWHFWLPDQGGCHGIIFGTTGSGKSGLLNVIFTEAKHSGVIATLFGDPDGGKSAPEWQEHVNVFAGTATRLLAMLQGLERIMDSRRRSEGRSVWTDHLGRRRRGFGSSTPTAEHPLLLCVIDEWPDIAADPTVGKECLRIIGRLAKKGRKYGIAIILLTQVPSLKEMGGTDAQAIRSMISGMNIAAFRTSDRFSDMMGLPMTLPVAPVDLPAKWPNGKTTAGIGYLVRDAGPATARALFQEDPLAWAMTGEAAQIPDAWMAVAGPYFRDWFALLDVDDDDAVEIRDGVGVRADETLAVPVTAAVTQAEVVKVWARIEEYLGGQPHGATTNMIVQATGVKQPTVATTLSRRLEKQGDVHKPRDGVWMLGAEAVLAGEMAEAV